MVGGMGNGDGDELQDCLGCWVEVFVEEGC